MSRVDQRLWALARDKQISNAAARERFLSAEVNGLCAGFAECLTNANLFGLDLSWSCEFFNQGVDGRKTAAVPSNCEYNDFDLILVVAPSATNPNSKVSLGLQKGLRNQFNKCSLEETTFGAFHRHVFDNNALEDVAQALRVAVSNFIAYNGLDVQDLSFKDGGTSRPMRASFTINGVPIDVLPAFKMSNMHLVLRRQVDADGSNVIRSFRIRTASQIGCFHAKASFMICALKHIAKVVGRVDAPGCLFEAVVLEIFGKSGRVIDRGDSTRFREFWRECWEMIKSAESIRAPGAAADDDENLFSRMGDGQIRLREIASDMLVVDLASLEEL